MMHSPHPSPGERDEFLVDGCPRCAQYLDDLGLQFDALRFQQFWSKMVSIEFDDNGGYASDLDKQLGRRLFYVALALQRAFGVDPRQFDDIASVKMQMFADAYVRDYMSPRPPKTA